MSMALNAPADMSNAHAFTRAVGDADGVLPDKSPRCCVGASAMPRSGRGAAPLFAMAAWLPDSSTPDAAERRM